MPRVDLYDMNGSKKGQINLPDNLFAVSVSEPLMAQAIRVYLANQRRAKAKTKSRSEVRGSRRKIWRQKGTGRARHGDRYAPIFVGGGRAHGPTGKENYQLKLSKKMKRLSLLGALSSVCQDKRLVVVEGLSKIGPKTKEGANLIYKIKSKDEANSKITLVLPEVLQNVDKAFRNISGVQIMQARQLNAYRVLNAGKLLLMKESIKVIEKTFSKNEKDLSAKNKRQAKKG